MSVGLCSSISACCAWQSLPKLWVVCTQRVSCHLTSIGTIYGRKLYTSWIRVSNTLRQWDAKYCVRAHSSFYLSCFWRIALHLWGQNCKMPCCLCGLIGQNKSEACWKNAVFPNGSLGIILRLFSYWSHLSVIISVTGRWRIMTFWLHVTGKGLLWSFIDRWSARDPAQGVVTQSCPKVVGHDCLYKMWLPVWMPRGWILSQISSNIRLAQLTIPNHQFKCVFIPYFGSEKNVVIWMYFVVCWW